ncbi:MAG: CBS domain-containing protein [Gaiellales bacterium]
MRVADIMQTDLLTCDPKTSVAEAARRMWERRVGACLITEGAELLGIFTERDLLRLVGTATNVQELPVSEVMTSGVTMAPPDAELMWAADTMRRLGVRHLPVGDGGFAIGIISIRDLFVVVEAVLRLDTESGVQIARELLTAARR